MTTPPRHPRFERVAAALRENLKRRKAQSRARGSVVATQVDDGKSRAEARPTGQEEQ
jgi:hypothetical protein